MVAPIPKLYIFLPVIVASLAWLLHPNYPKGSIGGIEFWKAGALTRIAELFLFPWYRWNGVHMTQVYRKLLSADGGKLYTNPGMQTDIENIAGVETVIITPAGWTRKQGSMVFFHGGGYAFGTPIPQYRHALENIAKQTNLRIFAPNYRKSPEHKWPIPYEDCYAVVDTLLNRADTYQIDIENYAISGDSAGGQLAIATTIQLAKEKRPAPKLVAVLYPATGLRPNLSTPGQRRCKHHPFLSFKLLIS